LTYIDESCRQEIGLGWLAFEFLVIAIAVFKPLAKDLEMGVASSFRELWKPDLDWHRSFQLFRVPLSVS